MHLFIDPPMALLLGAELRRCAQPMKTRNMAARYTGMREQAKCRQPRLPDEASREAMPGRGRGLLAAAA